MPAQTTGSCQDPQQLLDAERNPSAESCLHQLQGRGPRESCQEPQPQRRTASTCHTGEQALIRVAWQGIEGSESLQVSRPEQTVDTELYACMSSWTICE